MDRSFPQETSETADAARSAVSLLVVDDSPANLELLSSALAQPGLEILTESSPESALDLFRTRRPQVVLTDLKMPNMSGLELLDRIVRIDPTTDVILMTSHYSSESAVEAIKKGASDYLNKPLSIGPLRERIGRLVEEVRKRQRSVQLEDELRTNSEFEGIVGRSPHMLEMFYRIRRVAPHYRSLLITGETGTGKDLVARALHRLSPVASGRYVVLNCSAIVETLFESELFGHIKGSFTGAAHDKPGLFEYAHGGTLFLDEIGDMPIGTQAKLLRVLQNQEVQRVGSLSARKVDVRVIAATNHNLRAAVDEKRFREDLYYRLSMVEVQTPRLTDRREDLPLLQRHFLARFAAQYRKPVRGLTHRAQIRLSQHSWPGNVRELENVMGHAAMMASGEMVDAHDLPDYFHASPEHHEQAAALPLAGGTLADMEREYIRRVLREVGGVVQTAAERLGVPRTTLNAKMSKLGISRNLVVEIKAERPNHRRYKDAAAGT